LPNRYRKAAIAGHRVRPVAPGRVAWHRRSWSRPSSQVDRCASRPNRHPKSQDRPDRV